MCPNQQLHPVVDERGRYLRPIAGAPTARALFIGWTPRGPTNGAVEVNSWDLFVDRFGGLDPRSDLAYGVRHYFSNGGSELWVVRLKPPARRAMFGPDDPAFRQAVLALFDAGGHAAAVDYVSIVCVPGLSDQATLAQLMGKVAARRAFLVADCPASATIDNVLETVPQGPGRENAAIYFPWVAAIDPVTGRERHFPPSSFVCGAYARTDRAFGVWKAAAGLDVSVRGAVGLQHPLTDAENAPLNAQAINCLRRFPTGITIWGARTLAGRDDLASEWKYVPVRRLALFIEENVARGIEWAVFEPNDEALWVRLRQAVEAFMHNLFRQGAFRGSSPRECYFVKCDRETNGATELAAGIVTLLVGFAPLKPAEFTLLTIELRVAPSDD